MSDFDSPKNSPSNTPRVDHAELLIYADNLKPVSYVLSSFAKRLEIELNQALTELKAARLLEPSSNLMQTPASTTLPPMSTMQVVSNDGEKSRHRPHLIKPTANPQGAGESVHYKDGQILFNQGDDAQHLAIVLEGSVEIFDPIGNIRLAILGAGSSFGEQAILEGGIRDASARASGKVICLEIKTSTLRTQLIKDKGLLRQTIEGLLLQLSMCNQISKMIATPDTNLVYELLGDENLTSIELNNKLNGAYSNPGSHGLSAEQMMWLKLQSSDKLMSNWFESGTELGSPFSEHIGSAYVIVEGSVEATCGKRTVRLG